MPKKSIRTIYRDFGLRYDVREARKLLELPKNIPKKEVNRQLKLSYDYIFDEYYKTPTEKVYMYEVFGESRHEIAYTGRLSKPEPIYMSFQSKEKFKLYNVNLYYGLHITNDIKKQIPNNYPFADALTDEYANTLNSYFGINFQNL